MKPGTSIPAPWSLLPAPGSPPGGECVWLEVVWYGPDQVAEMEEEGGGIGVGGIGLSWWTEEKISENSPRNLIAMAL